MVLSPGCWCPGFDVTLQVDLSAVPENWEEVVKKCGLLKRNCFAAVFEKYFDFQVKITFTNNAISFCFSKQVL